MLSFTIGYIDLGISVRINIPALWKRFDRKRFVVHEVDKIPSEKEKENQNHCIESTNDGHYPNHETSIIRLNFGKKDKSRKDSR